MDTEERHAEHQHFGDARARDEVGLFACSVEAMDDGCMLVTAGGELDVHTCSEFKKVLSEAQSAPQCSAG